MTERGILMSAPMVRAILEGRKTQTRRIVKAPRGWPQYSHCDPFTMPPAVWWWNGEHERVGIRQECSHGVPADRLWVREAFMHDPATYCWEASVSIPAIPASTIYRADCVDPRGGRWSPSIHMPRSLSRITLEITDVRVERLQDISDADAVAEGVQVDECGHAIHEGDPIAWGGARGAYSMLWDRLNGAGSWDANPWVWVISFKRLPA
mgnify:CR=1 FL=1